MNTAMLMMAVVGDRIHVPSERIEYCRADCGGGATLRLFCVPCRALLANAGQVEMHVDTHSPGQRHVIVRWCQDHAAWEPWTAAAPHPENANA